MINIIIVMSVETFGQLEALCPMRACLANWRKEGSLVRRGD